jgi:hypothetical protein
MKKYRRKPIIDEAVQWTGSNHEEICTITGDDFYRYGESGVMIFTDEGDVTAKINDYIVRTAEGHYTSYTEEDFNALYEEYYDDRSKLLTN